MTQVLSKQTHNFAAFSHEREARAHGEQARWAQSITQHQGWPASFLDCPGFVSQSLAPTEIQTDSPGRKLEARYPGLFHTHPPTTWGSSPSTDWLKDALAELESIDDEIAEEALPEIQSHTKDKARAIISALATQSVAPTVYPTMDGEVALYFKSPVTTSSLLILVCNDGQAACFSYIAGKNRRARYEDATELPDEFVKAQLRALKETAFSKDA